MKLVVTEFISLDGVVQAPGAPEEDASGGFEHGGWAVPHFDDGTLQAIMRGIDRLDALLLGRRTYEIFAAHWPWIDDDNAIAARFNRVPKYVASRTLDELSWRGSQLLGPDVVADVERLRQAPGGELQVHGSATLVQTLLRHGLVDELKLWVFPVLVGQGRRLFADGTVPAGLSRQESHAFDSGVVMQAYRFEGPIAHASFALDTPTAAEIERRRRVREEGR